MNDLQLGERGVALDRREDLLGGEEQILLEGEPHHLLLLPAVAEGAEELGPDAGAPAEKGPVEQDHAVWGQRGRGSEGERRFCSGVDL